MIDIGTIGPKALYILFAWLISAAAAAWLADRKGYGERVGLALGLLLVDEPTSRQDEANARGVAALLAAAAHTDGQTVICATHDPTVIGQADHVLALGG